MTVGGRTRASLAPYFPLPLVGAAVLLAVLILLTPNLLSTGAPSAGSLESQAELLVDRGTAAGNGTHLYLRGIGLARYTTLALSWSPWNGSAPPTSYERLPLGQRVNGSELLSVSLTATATRFVVNASAAYVDAAGGTANYAGAWALEWSGGMLQVTPYGDVTGTSGPTAPDQLPLVLLLAELPQGAGA